MTLLMILHLLDSHKVIHFLYVRCRRSTISTITATHTFNAIHPLMYGVNATDMATEQERSGSSFVYEVSAMVDNITLLDL